MERIKITGEIEIPLKKLTEIKKKVINVIEFKKKIEEFLKASATEILEAILVGAISLNASDIHIEPEEEKAKLRTRIDGILHDVMVLNLKTFEILLSRIKLLSGIKLNIFDRPQDGRFSVLLEGLPVAEISSHLPPRPPERSEGEEEIKFLRPPERSEGEEEIKFLRPASQGSVIEIRTSVLPAEYGESVVLRILNPKSLIEIEALGLRKDLIEIFEKEIKKPNGMIIVTGPTGSGKTTTLYAILKKINSPKIKIITIEDPVEYHLEGVSQTQVDPQKGYNFASGLKSIMRQDPDVILVGEIRDLETAEIACQAALTGHLVFSTLHTNDAAGAIARLADLGAKPISIAPAVNMIVAQRLPRKVCKKCVKFENPSLETLKKLKKELSSLKIDQIDKNLKIPKAIGCKNCNFTGYRGRIGIYETFLISDEMEKFILTSPSIVAIRELAIKKGMVLMRKDGLIKVLEGITTIEEIDRVAGE